MLPNWPKIRVRKTSTVLDECDEFSYHLQVIIGTGCVTLQAYTLRYGGPIDCQPVPYIIAVCVISYLLIIVVIIACYERRKKPKITSAYPGYPILEFSKQNSQGQDTGFGYSGNPLNDNSTVTEFGKRNENLALYDNAMVCKHWPW